MSVRPHPAPCVPEREVEFSAVRAQGPGGQNVHKVSSAVHLRFDIAASSLPDEVKARLLALPDQRVSKEGVVVIKAQTSRSRDLNKAEAMARLQELVTAAATVAKTRRPTRPTQGSKLRRLQAKAVRAGIKAGRARADE